MHIKANTVFLMLGRACLQLCGVIVLTQGVLTGCNCMHRCMHRWWAGALQAPLVYYYLAHENAADRLLPSAIEEKNNRS